KPLPHACFWIWSLLAPCWATNFLLNESSISCSSGDAAGAAMATAAKATMRRFLMETMLIDLSGKFGKLESGIEKVEVGSSSSGCEC
ncbi:hypothetical protein EDC01DRAFT_673618, partial [Geopyxis carbonaria]